MSHRAFQSVFNSTIGIQSEGTAHAFSIDLLNGSSVSVTAYTYTTPSSTGLSTGLAAGVIVGAACVPVCTAISSN